MSVDINQYAEAEQTVEGCNLSADPIVLIIHTHGTEAYSEEGVFGYSETYNIPRSYDVTKNVIHIGSVIASVLNDNGVLTLQSDVMHDAESYLGAYERSAETVKDYLERYPTIKYVFDIHRDSVLLEDKTKTRPITVANGEVAAQIMTVAGSNELGAYHPNWEMNLTLAAKLQKDLNESYLGLARAICLRGSTYNQELAPYSLLFEVGSCGNSLKEAEVSARILANTLAEIIKNGW
jgi:stage II sporulation protein P